MTEEAGDERGLLATTGEVLGYPIVGARRIAAGRDGKPRSGGAQALIWLAFVPMIVLYEAFALPLVAGSVLLVGVLVIPLAVISIVGRRVRR